MSAIVLWGGMLARDYFWPRAQPPTGPILDPELPEGFWLPDPGHASWPSVYTNMDDVAKKIYPRRRLVFNLDKSKRRWVRDYKAEELLQTPPERPKPNIVPGRAWWLAR
jgi:hypothetical protein